MVSPGTAQRAVLGYVQSLNTRSRVGGLCPPVRSFYIEFLASVVDDVHTEEQDDDCDNDAGAMGVRTKLYTYPA